MLFYPGNSGPCSVIQWGHTATGMIDLIVNLDIKEREPEDLDQTFKSSADQLKLGPHKIIEKVWCTIAGVPGEKP